ncbi:proline-rich protein [Trifolium pratense]|uniref:Proline-rich protein n=1 Tax=Trifolium pratense TaxID=57577 RepID=A0A2K3JWJ7_TRIPR|nr:14 kDa proline-rich protein DC2.15-like [Trifolium pratense]PNX58431.1 proline-rich protein [Trifolium pratense]
MGSKSVASIAILSLSLLFVSTLVFGAIPSPTTAPNCQIEKLNVCVDLLDTLKVEIRPKTTPCCKIINGLVGLDASICLCAALKAGVLGTITADHNTSCWEKPA